MRVAAFVKRNVPVTVTETKANGAPRYIQVTIWDFLDIRFPPKWTERDGPITWPLRSPDLAAADFFLWGDKRCRLHSITAHHFAGTC